MKIVHVNMNQKYFMKLFSILLFSLVYTPIVLCQQTTTEDVKFETRYIDALRERSIGREDKAAKILEELYKSDRTNGEIAFELAKTYSKLNEVELVDKYAQKAIQSSPNNIWYCEFYGDFLMMNNRPEEAIEYFNQMVEIDPNEDRHYDRLTKAWITISNYSKAIEVLDQRESTFGPTKEIILEKFKTFDEGEHYNEAILQLDRLINLYPETERFLIMKANVQIKNQQEDQALNTYKKVLTINPSNSEANLALLGQGSDVENENAYIRALLPIINNRTIDVDSKVKELLPYINNLSVGKDQALSDALLEAGDRLIQTHPDQAKAHAAYADILYHTGNLQASIKQYEKTIELNDNIYVVWDQLMYALLEDEQYEKLVQVSEDCMDLFPNQVSALYHHGYGLMYSKRHEDASEILDEALMVSGKNNVLKSTVYVAIATNNLLQEKLELAKYNIDLALKVSDNKNPLAIELLGDYYLAIGNDKEAVTNWERSLKMGNQNTKLIQKIEDNRL